VLKTLLLNKPFNLYERSEAMSFMFSIAFLSKTDIFLGRDACSEEAVLLELTISKAFAAKFA
jgi:hypothetical protein